MGSAAFRHEESFACIVFSPVLDHAADELTAEAAINSSVQRLAKMLRDNGRVSDAIGRLGPTEFAIIAQDTDAIGATRLAERLASILQANASEGLGTMRMAAGIDVVANYHEAPIDPEDMLTRATKAMRQSRADVGGHWIRQFDTGTPN
jgi:diguanylate cyclase (GGDEF)-like protein